jgi:hypothetical protein
MYLWMSNRLHRGKPLGASASCWLISAGSGQLKWRGCTADRAFDLLQWRSQETNIKLRDLSSTLVRVVTEAKLTPDTLRHQVDHFLLTARHNAPKCG